MDSPYLSLISLVKGWPKQNIRREVLMITDGIDRLHGETPTASQLGPRFGARGTNGPTVYHSMPTISADADSASETSPSSSAASTRQELVERQEVHGISTSGSEVFPRSRTKPEANATPSAPRTRSASNPTLIGSRKTSTTSTTWSFWVSQ